MERPTLTTERLILRPFTPQDTEEFRRICNQPEVAATVYGNPYPMGEDEAKELLYQYELHFLYGYFNSFAITIKETNALIGTITISVIPEGWKGEIGFWIDRAEWNKGYCTEALSKIITFGFNNDFWNLRKVYARHLGCNPASGRVMQKVGMLYEGTIRKDVVNFGNIEDMVYYGMLREEFEQLKVVTRTQKKLINKRKNNTPKD